MGKEVISSDSTWQLHFLCPAHKRISKIIATALSPFFRGFETTLLSTDADLARQRLRTQSRACRLCHLPTMPSHPQTPFHVTVMRIAFTFGVILSMTSFAMASNWSAAIRVIDENGHVVDLEFGVNTLASDGIDANLGEIERPPPPPSNNFYVGWTAPMLGNGVLRDIRAIPTESDTLVFYLAIQRTGSVSLQWNPELLATRLQFAEITDSYGSNLLHLDMLTHDNIKIENSRIRELRLACVIRRIESPTKIGDIADRNNRPCPNDICTATTVKLYPNPGNSSAVVSVYAPTNDVYDINVFNAAGQRIIQLVKDATINGHYSIVWNGRDANDRTVSSGVYWIRVHSAQRRITESLVLLR